MSDYEIYIAGFALIGWCFAGHYYIQSKHHKFAGIMLTRSLLGVALGKTKIEVIDGGLKITDLKDTNHGNTSNQTRQGEGTDRS